MVRSELIRLIVVLVALPSCARMLFAVTADSDSLLIPANVALIRLLPNLQKIMGARPLAFTIEGVLLTVKQNIAIAMLINELVSNAVKHGDNEVSVTLTQEGAEVAGEARLAVKDDGPGFPTTFSASNHANTGLELVESLSRWDLQGAVRYENCEGGGACVTVLFPLDSLTARIVKS